MYTPGQWLVICDVCGVEYLSGEVRHRWDHAIVCTECWEPRHPHDLVPPRTDKLTVPFSRPEPADVFTEVAYPFYMDLGYVTPETYAETGGYV